MTPATRAFGRTAGARRDPVQAAIDAARAACGAALDDAAAAARSTAPGAVVRLHDAIRSDDGAAAAERLRAYATSESAAAAALVALPPSGPARARLVREDLLRAALAALPRVAELPVAPSVKLRICEVFRMFCEPPRGDDDARFRPDLGFHACALAGCATLTRFPAGQLDWQVSGVPRSYLLRMPFADLPRVARAILGGMGGLRPCFVAHMGVRRYPLLFVEVENHRSYHRMAQSMALQPGIRGLLMEAWFHSPETIRVSPHLEWTNRTPLANGATLTDLGPAPPHAGFLTGSPERQRLYESGAYRPTIGLIIWPRQPLLAWAAAHPEFGVEADTG